MSIASRIEAIEEHLEDDYLVLELAGADLTNVDKNIINLKETWKERLLYFMANGTDVVWNNWLPKVTGSGETITLNNTIETKMNIVYKGNTSQSLVPSGYTQVDYITSDGNSYIDTGKTLGDNFKIETKFIHNQQSSDEQPIISTWVSSYQWFNLYIASNNQLRFYTVGNHMTANPTLTLGSINTVSYSRSSNHWIGVLNGEEVSFNATLSTTNPTTFKIFARGDNTLGSYVSIYRLKLYEDNVLTMDLIPCYRNSDNVIGMYDIVNNIFYTNSGTGNFTYGSVAPNPDYPQDIQVVSGDNTIKVENANLCSSFRNGTGTGKYLASLAVKAKLKPNSYYEISFIDNSTGNDYYRNESITNKFSSYEIISNGQRQYWSFLTKSDITPNDNGEYVIFKNTISQSAVPQFTDVDIREVSQITTDTFDYEPYQSQSYPINIGNIELCKIGDYQDKIYKDSGKWYLNKQIGKVVLNGSEGWTKGSQTNVSVFVLSNVIYPQVYGENGVGLSNRFKYEYVNNANAFYFGWSNNVVIVMPNTYTLESFKTWLSSNNTSVYYITTPTYEEITDTTLISQLEAIKKSYNNQTNISQTNADKPFILDVTALGN